MSNRHFLHLTLLLLAACSTPSRTIEHAAAPTSAPRESVNPGINEDYLDPELDVSKFVERFETESREVYAEREKIVELVGLKPGQRVADIGAGTGLFTLLFAQSVGPQGVVYGVDIAPGFVERLDSLARERNLPQIESVLCSEDDVRLPAASIDVAFVCDTYHHFEYPASTLASLHRALMPGGQVIVIDFHRIEGESREWILGHVRAGQDVFTSEIEAAGFEALPQAAPPGLKENYMLRFRRR